MIGRVPGSGASTCPRERHDAGQQNRKKKGRKVPQAIQVLGEVGTGNTGPGRRSMAFLSTARDTDLVHAPRSGRATRRS